MKVQGVHHRSIQLADDGWSVEVVEQRLLPHEFRLERLTTLDDAARAIADMIVRGAPLIGATAAYGLCLALREDPSDASLVNAAKTLQATRPTAVNLRWALDEMGKVVEPLAPEQRAKAAYAEAARLCEADVAACSDIGEHGLMLLHRLAAAKHGGAPLNILTHCNAGWLATVDWGTALAPIYKAHDAGVPLHVWVDETRPRNQGASLTAWELANHGVPHTVIVDNAGGHLMQRGHVDCCIVGSDRTTRRGDVCNKIGTYLKALAARENHVPFYVALPSSTIDFDLTDGLRDIPIEERSGDEVRHICGVAESGDAASVRLMPEESPVANPAFDVTPARLVTALITERGVCEASEDAINNLFPERTQRVNEGLESGK
jgi:methylthioribose-1-phosphate isomerase